MNRRTQEPPRLRNFGIVEITRHIDRERNSFVFPLGTNRRPFEPPPTYKPLQRHLLGGAVQLNGERIENPDYGVAWSPRDTPGPALTFGHERSCRDALLIPALLTYGGSAVVTDIGGELEWITAEQRRRIGHRIVNADPFGIVQRNYADAGWSKEPATKYNPLAGLLPDDPGFAQRLAVISEALAVGHESYGAVISDLVRKGIESAVAAAAAAAPGRATFRDVRRRLSSSVDEFAGGLAKASELSLPGEVRIRLSGFAGLDTRTQQMVLVTANEATKFLDDEAIASYFSPGEDEETFSFDELAEGRLSVYIVVPPSLATTHSAFTRLLLNQALDAARRFPNGDLDHPTAFLVDAGETGIGRLEAMERVYGPGRTPGCAVWSFYDALPQLQRVYPDTWESIVTRCACVTLTEVKDVAGQEFFAGYIGVGHARVRKADLDAVKDRGRTSPSAVPTSAQLGPGSALAIREDITGADGGEVDIGNLGNIDASALFVLMPSSLGNFTQRKLNYREDFRFNHMYRLHPKEGLPPLPGAYPHGPYAQPTIDPPDVLRKRRLRVWAATLVALFLIGAIFKFVLGLLLSLVAVWLAYKYMPRKGKPGDWWIDLSSNDGIGVIAGYPERDPVTDAIEAQLGRR